MKAGLSCIWRVLGEVRDVFSLPAEFIVSTKNTYRVED